MATAVLLATWLRAYRYFARFELSLSSLLANAGAFWAFIPVRLVTVCRPKRPFDCLLVINVLSEISGKK